MNNVKAVICTYAKRRGGICFDQNGERRECSHQSSHHKIADCARFVLDKDGAMEFAPGLVEKNGWRLCQVVYQKVRCIKVKE